MIRKLLLLTVAVFLLLFPACQENGSDDASNDTLVSILPVPVSSRSTVVFSAGDYDYIDSTELYWTYEAVMADSDSSTVGQTDGETLLQETPGLPEDAWGEFTPGTWTFTFNAYSDSALTEQYYIGEAVEAELTAETDEDGNIIPVELYFTVTLAQASGDTTGTIIIYSLVFYDRDKANEIDMASATGYSLTCQLNDGDEYDVSIADASSESGCALEDIEAGYYTITINLYKSADIVATATSGDDAFLLKASSEVTVTGELTEDTYASPTLTVVLALN